MAGLKRNLAETTSVCNQQSAYRVVTIGIWEGVRFINSESCDILDTSSEFRRVDRYLCSQTKLKCMLVFYRRFVPTHLLLSIS